MPETMTFSLLTFWNYLSRQGFLFIFTTALALVVLVLLLSAGGEAREIVVDEEEGGNYTDLPQAMTNATDGDTIVVREGNYTARFPGSQIKTSVRIVGAGRERTRLNFTDNYIISLAANNISISGVNFSVSEDLYTSGIEFNWFYENISLANCSFYGLKDDVAVARSAEDGPTGLILENNSFWGTMLDIPFFNPTHLRALRITNNTVNGRPFFYLVDQDGGSFFGPAGGFFLINCTNIRVRDVEMGSFATGINIFQSSNITIEESQVTARRDSIYVSGSRSISVLNCQVEETDPFPYPSAIYYYNVSGGKITGNFLPNTTITINFGTLLEIRNNTITGRTETSSSTSRFGIEVGWSTELTITGNEMEDDGIILQKTFTNPRTDKPEYYAHEINDNSVAGRPIYYYRDQSGITVSEDAGQVILVNCTNMTLHELNISGRYHAVTLSRTSNSTIGNCHFQSNLVGVRLIASHDNKIEGCAFLEKGGLYQEYSNNTIIMNNVFSGSGSYGAFYTGIFLSKGRGSEIRNNCCTGVGNGILIWLSTDALITGNTITKTWDAGIEVQQSIEHNTIIRLNNISGNLRFGIIYDDLHEGGTLNARYNWWGAPSGPFQSLKNPNGTGDRVSDLVDFSPWQTEENPVNWSYDEPEATKKESDEKPSATLGLSMLLFCLILVFILLVVVVRLPDERFSKTRVPPREAEMIEPPTSPQRINSCPHCGGEFEVETLKRPIRFSCHFCGKKIEFK